MQLFIIDENPGNAAEALADCHVRKQILETAQILTAYWINSGLERLEWMPRPQNVNHPVVRALMPDNVGWVLDLFPRLCHQFRLRHGHSHKYWEYARRYMISMAAANIVTSAGDNRKLETFHRMFSGFTPVAGDIVSEYRQYYRWKSQQIKHFRYTGVKPPAWLTSGCNPVGNRNATGLIRCRPEVSGPQYAFAGRT